MTSYVVSSMATAVASLMMAHDLPMGLSLSLFPPELPSYLIAVLDYKIWSVMPVSIISAIIIFGQITGLFSKSICWKFEIIPYYYNYRYTTSQIITTVSCYDTYPI